MPAKNINDNDLSEALTLVEKYNSVNCQNNVHIHENVSNDPYSHSTSGYIKSAASEAGLRRRRGVRATASMAKEDGNSNTLLGENLRANGNSPAKSESTQAVRGFGATQRQRPLQAGQLPLGLGANQKPLSLTTHLADPPAQAVSQAAQASVNIARISDESFDKAMCEMDTMSTTLHSIYTNGENSDGSFGLPSRNSLTPLNVSSVLRCGNSTFSNHPDTLGSTHSLRDAVTLPLRIESYPHTLSSKQRCSEHSKRILETTDAMPTMHDTTTRTSENHGCIRVNIREDLNTIVHFSTTDAPQQITQASHPTHKCNVVDMNAPQYHECLTASTTADPHALMRYRGSIMHTAINVRGKHLPSRRRVTILIDSGATDNFISSQFVASANYITSKRNTLYQVKLADGTHSQSSHEVREAKLTLGTHTESLTLSVLPLAGYDIILGKPWLHKHNPRDIDWTRNIITLKDQQGQTHTITQEAPQEVLQLSHKQIAKVLRRREEEVLCLRIDQLHSINADTPATQSAEGREAEKQIIAEYADVFTSDLPTGPPTDKGIEHTIPLLPGSQPCARAPYRLSYAELDELKKQIDELLSKGHIRPSTSEYASPVLFVRKKDGSSRMCVDYRALNKQTKRNRYPLPRIDDLLDRLHASTIFSKIDLRSGYHQVKVAEADIHKTAFTTRYGLYEFTVLPFGLTDAPATFMTVMNRVLQPYLDEFVVVYLDDIMIYSKNMEEHTKHLRLVLDKLRQYKMHAKQSKCTLYASEVDFIGQRVSAKGLQADPTKVQALIDWPEPTNVHEIRQFLGLAQYFRRYIKAYSAICSPLSTLTRKDVPWTWTQPQKDAFTAIKTALTSAPVLRLADPSSPFILVTDASNIAVGATLMQRNEHGRLQPIAYESQKLNPAQTRYPTHDKELLAIVHALHKWRHYLHAQHFTIHTDHQSLRYIQTQPHLNGRQARWVEFLAEFDFTIEYKPGESGLMRVPDALSRCPAALSSPSLPSATAAIYSLTSSTIHLGKPLLDRIRNGYLSDRYYKPILTHLLHPDSAPVPKGLRHNIRRFHLHDNIIYLDKNRICVPHVPGLRSSLLHEVHDAPTAGHLGSEKTYQLLAGTFFWPYLFRDVVNYVRSCDTCQRNKAANTNTATSLQPLSIPSARWEAVSMDFITQLPTTRKSEFGENPGFDAIFVVVCRLTKMAHFIATHTNATAATTAFLYMQHIFRLHGMPSSIVSDRDSKFTSAFWQALHSCLGTRLDMTTAFHPQSDGQTERTNRTLEDILRAYVSTKQDDWHLYLHLAEFAYNNSVQASSKHSPFFANYGHHPRTPLSLLTPPTTPLDDPVANDFVHRMSNILHDIQDHLRLAQERQAHYANQHRTDRTFAVGDRVLLDLRFMNITGSTRTTHKFLPRHQGPYRVVARCGPAAYKLDLPASWKVHPVFYVGLLKPYIDPRSAFPDRITTSAPLHDADGEPIYVVERILDKRFVGRTPNRQLEYKVLWAGYPESAATWEPPSHLRQPEVWAEVEAFEARLRASPPTTPPSPPTPPSRPPSPPSPPVIGTRRSPRLAAQPH